jgi:hypothetical protein
MTQLAAHALPAAYLPDSLAPPTITPRDRVRVPDGSVGKVIGFYRTDKVAVLVRLDDGDSRQYVPADLRLVN